MRRPIALLTAALVGLASPATAQTTDHAAGLPAADGVALDVSGVALDVGGVAIVLSESSLDGSVGIADGPEQVEVTLSADVLFAFDSARLTRRARRLIAQVAPRLADATGPVEIVGHTDNVGSDAYNDRLSLRRARAVRDVLRGEAAAAGARMTIEGRGERDPVARNRKPNGDDNPRGRALNRRVTITIPSQDG
jgi:outer membrane protein OmpA-like peptidoglycan-associated protein